MPTKEGHLCRVCTKPQANQVTTGEFKHGSEQVCLPGMAAGCSPGEAQEHRSAAWRLGVRARLAKKATFEAAVADLVKALHASPAAATDPAIAELIERSFTLLRTRYTAPGFWSAGRALYASGAQASQLANSLFTSSVTEHARLMFASSSLTGLFHCRRLRAVPAVATKLASRAMQLA